jgi:hypothetical protein
VERLAGELRALRAVAGNVAFWKMARRCEVSKSALAAAAAGRDLPSERVTHEFVRACGGDWSWWRERWSQASAELAARGDSDSREPGAGVLAIPSIKTMSVLGRPVSSRQSPRSTLEPSVETESAETPQVSKPRRVRRAITLVSAVIMVTAAVTAMAARSLDRPAPQYPAVSDGTDPQAVGCTADKVTLETSPVVLQQQAQLRGRRLSKGTRVGTISLVYSARCAGAWARFDPTPGLNPDPDDSTVGTTTVEADRPADNTQTLWKMGHIDNAYSGILLTGMGCVFARAQVEMVGQDVSAVGQTRCLLRPS